jgi:cytochrome c oxidase cbb3-type subunit 3
MSLPSPDHQPPPGDEDALRPHAYDGIREYDKRLPNWWLHTLYWTIVFSVVYWFVHITAALTPTDGARVDRAMAEISATRMASSIDVTNDALFWEMSRNPVFVEAGRLSYVSNCIPCHLPSLRGKGESPAAIGPNLVDRAWIHGGTPKEIYRVVAQGVPPKGMLAWEPILGQKKAAEIVAFILSHHQEGEPIEVEQSP